MALMFHKYELDGRAKDLGNGIYLGIITVTSHQYEFVVTLYRFIPSFRWVKAGEGARGEPTSAPQRLQIYI